jgi:hypothetical protein
MIELSSIRDRHRGQCIAVLGGGPSLLRDLKRVPFDAVLIGVNQHTLLMNLDYVVFQDRETYPVVVDSDAPLCTHHRDLAHIYTGIVPDFGLSGGTAVWMADYLGADEIIIAGMDFYTGDRAYWHSNVGTKHPFIGNNCGDVWKRVHDYMARPGIVRVCSGPMTEIFKPL